MQSIKSSFKVTNVARAGYIVISGIFVTIARNSDLSTSVSSPSILLYADNKTITFFVFFIICLTSLSRISKFIIS